MKKPKKYLRKNNQYLNSNLSFIDMLFLLLLHVFALFILAIILVNPQSKKKADETAEFLVTMTWPDSSADDMDLWVQLPTNENISYLKKESTYAALERDDLGISNDWIPVGDKLIPLHTNKEVIRVRSKLPGKYVVAVVLYNKKANPDLDNQIDPSPIPVKIQVEQVNPRYAIMVVREVVLTDIGEEKTAFSFELTDKGDVKNRSFDEQPFATTALQKAAENQAMRMDF